MTTTVATMSTMATIAYDSEEEHSYDDGEEEYSYDDDGDDDDYEYDDTDSDDEGAYNDGVDTEALIAQHGVGVKFVPAPDFEPEMNKYVHETADITGLASDITTVLLNQYNWSKDKLVEEYCMDPDKVLRNCGMYNHVYKHARSSSPQRKSKTCPICYEDEDSTDPFLAMVCGHSFCKSCWKGYVANAIAEEGPSVVRTLKCAEATCPERLTSADVAMALGDDQGLKETYQLFQLRNFISASELACWCPGKGCQLVASAPSRYELERVNKQATCKNCEVSFCISCAGEEAHTPCSCSILKAWKDKCESEGMNATWLVANTKKCPKCHRRIQKNGGCNHMTCRNGCGHEFCWLCFKDWKGHHSCNSYNTGGGGDRDKPNDDQAKNAQREIERYIHYHDRYQAHDQGQTFAQEKWDQWNKTIQCSAKDLDWERVVLARDANKLLATCRRVLKYSYAQGYVLFDGSSGGGGEKSLQQERFEDRQQQLEAFTERLSGETEKQIHDMGKSQVVDLSCALGAFIRNMVECADGE